jgi:hypothetical protein
MPFKVALMVAVNCEERDVVLIVKVALVAPAGTVTLAGTATSGAPELARLIVVGTEAAALKVIVPCDALPPTTLAGFKVNDDMTGALAAGGVTVRIALLDELPKVAVIVTCVGVETAAAAKSVKAEFWNEKGMLIERGRATISGRLLVNMIGTPSFGALAAMVTTRRTP